MYAAQYAAAAGLPYNPGFDVGIDLQQFQRLDPVLPLHSWGALHCPALLESWLAVPAFSAHSAEYRARAVSVCPLKCQAAPDLSSPTPLVCPDRPRCMHWSLRRKPYARQYWSAGLRRKQPQLLWRHCRCLPVNLLKCAPAPHSCTLPVHVLSSDVSTFESLHLALAVLPLSALRQIEHVPPAGRSRAGKWADVRQAAGSAHRFGSDHAETAVQQCT